MKSGQVLILVLLVVVVALSVGLSFASRNLTNLRTSTQTEHSQRAFTAAEGGVEDVLSRLSTLKSDPQVTSATGKTETIAVGTGISTTVNIKANGGYFERPIELGEVAQLNLDGGGLDQIFIGWAKSSDPSEKNEPASIEVTVIYDDGGTYKQTRYFFQGVSGRANESGSFSLPGACGVSGFAKCADVPIPVGVKLLRIRPIWNKSTVAVSKVANGDIPVQSYEITSTAQTEAGITRKVQVTKSAYAQLPAVFDFALYSETDIVK